MAKGDKTEQATPKKRRDARRKGQVARSADLTGWSSLLVGLHLLPMTVGRIAEVVAGALTTLRESAAEPDQGLAVALLGSTLRDGLLAIAPLVAVVCAVSVLATISQTGVMLTLKPLVPDFKRVSPKRGLQRLFSPRSAWETVKQTAKIAIVIGIGWPRARGLVDTLAGSGRLPLSESLAAAGAGVLGLARTIAWTMFVLSLADYAYQRHQHRTDLRMTKQEVKDEYKNAEGDGSIKARMRALQRSYARNRMIADMGMADVVVTNPTHIAVALRYDPERRGAPIVVASGAGALAARIRERARGASIPIVEAKPLARALWRACEVGDEIPVALYEAVAKVLAFVRRLDRRMTSGRPMDLPANARVDDRLLEAIPRRRRRAA